MTSVGCSVLDFEDQVYKHGPKWHHHYYSSWQIRTRRPSRWCPFQLCPQNLPNDADEDIGPYGLV